MTTPPTTLHETAQILRSAAELIERNGWVQGSFTGSCTETDGRPGSPLCAVGAIRYAAGSEPHETSPEADQAEVTLADYLAYGRIAAAKDATEVVTWWNDLPTRTAAEVVAALRAAAQEA